MQGGRRAPCLGCVKMGFKLSICPVEANEPALTSIEKMRGWTHAPGIDIFALSKTW